MRKVIASILACAVLVGCGTTTFTDMQITGAAAAGTKAALLGIPAGKQAAVKNWMYYIATRLRTLSGEPTPQQIGDFIMQAIPTNVSEEIPELRDIVVPAIIMVYTPLYNQFKTQHERLLKILNDIATGVEAVAGS